MIKVFFRVDANSKSASGHVTRCLTIADALSRKNAMCEFIVADMQSTFLIERSGYPVTVLCSEYNRMEKEIGKLISVIEDKKIELLILDSYFITEAYVEQLSRYTKIIYLNDIFELPLSVDMIISYGNISNRIDYEKIYRGHQKKPYVLMGRKYTPLRKEFENCICVTKEQVSDILVTVGGADENCFLQDMILALEDMDSFNFHIVVGVYNKSIKKIRAISDKRTNILVYEHCNDISRLMQNCDVAVSAGGTTIYELCAVGTPTICVSSAQNQRGLVTEMNNRGLMIYAGDVTSDKEKTIENIRKEIIMLANDYKERCRLSACMREFVDGSGADRIVGKILEVFKD